MGGGGREGEGELAPLRDGTKFEEKMNSCGRGRGSNHPCKKKIVQNFV